LKSLLLITALLTAGCAARPARNSTKDGRRLALGGVFWRKATAAYATRGSTQPILTIPKRSACDVREFSGGWSRVKVLVGGGWRLVWVRDLPANKVGMVHHPYLTFGYVSFGTDERPDIGWPRSRNNLLAEAQKEQMTKAELTDLFGAELVNPDARPGKKR
jgi:hypothetical protein